MTLDELREFGANVDEGLGRCMGFEDMYLRLVGTIKDDASFDKLNDALNAGDLDGAFELAHALKGTLGNLAITPLYDPMCEITELLRARTDADYAALMTPVMEALERFRAL